MPRYSFKAYDSSGRLDSGEIDAEDERTALNLISKRGLFPLEIVAGEASSPETGRWWRRELGGSRQMSAAAQAVLARELAMLLEAGVTVDEALALIILQPRIDAASRALIAAVQADVRSGSSLSAALAARGRTVPETFWMLVRAGEAGGTLGGVLSAMATTLEDTARTRKQLQTAMTYPLVLLGASALTVALIVTVMVPAILPLFQDAGMKPPLLISGLAVLGETVVGYWHLVLALIVALALLVKSARRSERAGLAFDRIALSLPVLGHVVQLSQTARFARTLSVLLSSGVPMLEALRVSGNGLQNRVFKAAIRQTEIDVNGGSSLSSSLESAGQFPALALRLFALGEQSSQLPAMLGRIAGIFEDDVRRRIEGIIAISTPAATVLVGGLVGFIMLSVVNAMLSLNEVALR